MWFFALYKITDLWQKRTNEYSEETRKIIENGYVTEPIALYHYTSIDVLKNILAPFKFEVQHG